MRRILLVKLTRMGDILETQPLLRDIRRCEPGAHIAMLVNETFRQTAALLWEVDEVVSFPIFDFLHALREGERDLVDLYEQLEAFADRLEAADYDLALNLTNSRLSGLLMGFVRARQKRGLRYDVRGGREVEGPLIRYFGANEGMRRFSPFNLSDFMRCLYGAPALQGPGLLRLDPNAQLEAATLLEPLAHRPLVGIQLGASEACKRWRVGHYAQLARELLRSSDCGLVMFGSGEERALVDAFFALIPEQADRVLNLVGKTAIPTLAAVTAQLKVLVTNDTGTMHLAAALNVHVINISLGSAFFRETGPYGQGHLILEPRIECRPCDYQFECEHFNCMSRIPVPLVVGLVCARLNGQEALGSLLAPWTSCDVYQTVYDEDGLLDYACITPHALCVDEVMLHVFRVALLQAELGGDFDTRLRAGMGRMLRDGNGLLPDAMETLLELLGLLTTVEQAAQRASRLIDAAFVRLNEGDMGNVEMLVGQYEQIDRRLHDLARSHAHLRLLVRAYVLGRESLRGSRVEMLLRGEQLCFNQLWATAGWARRALTGALERLWELDRGAVDAADELPASALDAG